MIMIEQCLSGIQVNYFYCLELIEYLLKYAHTR